MFPNQNYRPFNNFLLAIIGGLLLLSCTVKFPQDEPSKEKDLSAKVSYTPVSWGSLGTTWQEADFQAAKKSLLRSCKVYSQRAKNRFKTHRNIHNNPLFGTYAQWGEKCQQLSFVKKGSLADFYKNNFRVYKIASLENHTANGQTSLLTGYYAPILKGSYSRSEKFNAPLYSLPKDLLTADLGDFYPELKGKRIVARVASGNRVKPYFTRHEIAKSPENRPQDSDAVLFLENSVDAFFLHIQGSGIVGLPDGKTVGIRYDGNNGHTYTAIGRTMLKRGLLKKEEISMENIRRILEDYPQYAQSIMNSNPRYIYFDIGDAVVRGSLGVELVSEHSLAVDPKFIPLGVPLLVSSNITANGGEEFHKVMSAQDTGGAINGAVRGDIYFGKGKQAARLAGEQNSAGNIWVMVPR